MTEVKSLEVFSKSTFYGIDYFNMHETVNDCLMVKYMRKFWKNILNAKESCRLNTKTDW